MIHPRPCSGTAGTAPGSALRQARIPGGSQQDFKTSSSARLPLNYAGCPPAGRASGLKLILLLASFLAAALARQRLFHALLLARFQIKGVPLDLLDYVFCLYLALEATQGVLQRFALLQSHFCQT